MHRLRLLYRTTLGKKAIVAITGVVLFGFVVTHVLGNLKVFTGNADDGTPHIDVYAQFLRTMGEPMLPHGTALWTVRIILLVSFALHVAVVIQLAKQNHQARPIEYAQHVHAQSNRNARVMLISGLLLIVFLIVHILQFTTGTIDITPIIHGEVYANLYDAFQKWFFTLFYVVAMALLGSHLYHGAWSLFQTLGLDNPDRNRGLRLFAAISAVVVFVGFCAVPVLFFVGVLPAPKETVMMTPVHPTGVE